MVEESILFTPDIDDRTLKREVRDVNDQLNDAGTINPEIGDVSGVGGGGAMAGGPRNPARRISRGVDDLVPMADYRNRLLEDILDAVQGGGGGGDGFLGRLLGSLPSLGALIGGGAVALGALILSKLNPVNLAKLLGEKIGDVLPEDLVDPVQMTASALIKSPLAITAGMLIASKAVIGAGDVIASKASVALEDLAEIAQGEGSPSGEGGPSPEQLFAAGGLLAGGGALLGRSVLGGGGGNILGRIGGGALLSRGTASGAARLGSGPIGLGLLGAQGIFEGGTELAEIAGGGEGYAFARDVGEDFRQSSPGAADFIRTGFMNNPITDLGRGFGNILNGGGGGNVDAAVRRRNRQMGLSRTETQRVNVNANVQIDASNMQDIDREMDKLKEEVKRDIERNMSQGNSTSRRP